MHHEQLSLPQTTLEELPKTAADLPRGAEGARLIMEHPELAALIPEPTAEEEAAREAKDNEVKIICGDCNQPGCNGDHGY